MVFDDQWIVFWINRKVDFGDESRGKFEIFILKVGLPDELHLEYT